MPLSRCPNCDHRGPFDYSVLGPFLARYCPFCVQFLGWTPLGKTLGDYCLTFGRHRGKRLDDVPPDYLAWALDNMEELTVDQICILTTYLRRDK